MDDKEQHSIIPTDPEYEPVIFEKSEEANFKTWVKSELVRIAETEDVTFDEKKRAWNIKKSPKYVAQILRELAVLNFDVVQPANGSNPEKRYKVSFAKPKFATHASIYLGSGQPDGDADGKLGFQMTAAQVATPYGNNPIWTSVEVVPLNKTKDDADAKNKWALVVHPDGPTEEITFAPRFYKQYNFIVTRANGGKEKFLKVVVATHLPEDMEEELKKLFDRAHMPPPKNLKDYYKRIDGNFYGIRGVPLLRLVSEYFNSTADPKDPANKKRRDQQDKDRVYEIEA